MLRGGRRRLTSHLRMVEPGGYHCTCISCEDWRSRRVVAGAFVEPATANPKKMSPGTVPVWLPGKWKKQGWSIRIMEQDGIPYGTVIGYVRKDDTNNGGHLDCVFLLCYDGELRVTSRRWLSVIKT